MPEVDFPDHLARSQLRHLLDKEKQVFHLPGIDGQPILEQDTPQEGPMSAWLNNFLGVVFRSSSRAAPYSATVIR